MKHSTFKSSLLFIALLAGLFITACKSKDSSNAANNDTVTAPLEPQPDNASVKPDTMQTQVQISPDDSLTMMAKDAVKDYPGVTATVSNGEVTLTGDITRSKLPKLMMAVNATHPKKVNNKLTVK